jgi:hypothetical protein
MFGRRLEGAELSRPRRFRGGHGLYLYILSVEKNHHRLQLVLVEPLSFPELVMLYYLGSI